MSLIFAIFSRRHAGNRFFQRYFVLAAALLACLSACAQGKNADALISSNVPPPSLAAGGTNPVPSLLLPDSPVTRTNGVLSFSDSGSKAVGQTAANATTLQYQAQLEEGRNLRLMRQPTLAEPILTGLLVPGIPDSIQREALLELAMVAQDETSLVRSEQIYAQFVSRFSNDKRIPEVYLRQGRLFRQMGLNSLALAKFYSVMTSALALKNDQLDYYQQLVLDAQTEIAETQYQAGKFADAADFFSRLIKQNSPRLNRADIQFRLIRSLQNTTNYTETAAEARDYLSRFPESPLQPEVRFCLAQALKEMGQNNEALQQVLALLKEQRTQAKDHPEVWAYWQQRTGNEIANQLYHEGDYPKALDIYLSLEQLDHSPTWQIPVTYQIGMTYERLLQPEMAMNSYSNILSRETELGTNTTPGLKAILDMARWRMNFVGWQSRADNINHALTPPSSTKRAANDARPSKTAIP
jgi:tetratricopeptide (TPR) repeat protein